MDIEADIATKAETLRKALHAKLSIKGRSFDAAVRRAGRLLPRRIRRQAAVITKALVLGGHPKLMRMVDQKAVDLAVKDITSYLAGIDPADRRRAWWLKWTGLNVLNVLIVGAGFVVWLVWFGNN
jgi:hypothetical protein